MKAHALHISHAASMTTDKGVAIDDAMTHGMLPMDSYAPGTDEVSHTRAMRHGTPETAAPLRLSQSEVAAICHPLQFTSPQEDL
jgi:hypothetical protein